MTETTASDLVAELAEARKLRHVAGPGQFHEEMRRANFAIVHHNIVASEHFGPLVAALEGLLDRMDDERGVVAAGGYSARVSDFMDASSFVAGARTLLAAVARAAKEAL